MASITNVIFRLQNFYMNFYSNGVCSELVMITPKQFVKVTDVRKANFLRFFF